MPLNGITLTGLGLGVSLLSAAGISPNSAAPSPDLRIPVFPFPSLVNPLACAPSIVEGSPIPGWLAGNGTSGETYRIATSHKIDNRAWYNIPRYGFLPYWEANIYPNGSGVGYRGYVYGEDYVDLRYGTVALSLGMRGNRTHLMPDDIWYQAKTSLAVYLGADMSATLFTAECSTWNTTCDLNAQYVFDVREAVENAIVPADVKLVFELGVYTPQPDIGGMTVRSMIRFSDLGFYWPQGVDYPPGSGSWNRSKRRRLGGKSLW